VLAEVGRYDETIAQYEAALQACNERVKQDPDDPTALEERAAANIYLATALRPLGRPDQEANAYAKAIGDYEALADALPNSPRLAEHLARARINLGGLFHKLGQIEQAESQLQAAGELLEALFIQASTHSAPAQDATTTLLDLNAYLRRVRGELERDRGMLEEATASLSEAIVLYDRLLQAGTARDGSRVTRHVEGRARCKSHLAQTLQLSGDPQQADQLYAAAAEELNALEPSTPVRRDSLAFVYQHWAVLLRDQREDEAANRRIEQARELWRGLASEEAAAPETRHRWAQFLANCPFDEQRQPAQAVQLAERLTEDVADNATYWNTLGIARFRSGDEAGAIKALTKAIETRATTHGLDWLFLAMAQLNSGEAGEAERSFERGSGWVDEWLPHHAESQHARAEAAGLIQRNGRDP
jgi:tetratricopeptide (TPR) repeat protein